MMLRPILVQRKGFVSNSSSSSYIIVVDEEIRTVEELMRYVKNYDYAIRVFNRNFICDDRRGKQDGVVICSSTDTSSCEDCHYRFKCYTNKGNNLVTACLRWLYGDDYTKEDEEDLERFCGEMLKTFNIMFQGKIAYFIRLPDSGEDGDCIDSEIREEARNIINTPKALLDI